ncbi:MAG: sprT domain-containing protein [Salibacteraceae bacterium]
MNNERHQLSSYLPEERVESILEMLKVKKAVLKITRHRKSKFGDYRPPFKGAPHTITINGSLNKYAFLLTFLHEFAHLQMFEIFKGRILPHGKEWKTAFSLLIFNELSLNTFPEPLLKSIKKYALNPKASTFSDPELFNALRKFDLKQTDRVQLIDLDNNAQFVIGKKAFIRGELRRTRFLCEEKSTGKKYLVHKNAEVTPV